MGYVSLGMCVCVHIIIIIMVYCNVVYYVAYVFDKVSEILFIHLLQIK